MRAAAILGMGCTLRNLKPFQQHTQLDWRIGLPGTSDQVEAILIFGGDGTIHRHLPQLVRLKLPVLVVPLGSGNDFSRALGLATVRDSLEAWRTFTAGAGTIRTIDLGVIQPLEHSSTLHYFATVSSIGLDAEVARRASQLPRWLRGHGGYALALPQALRNFTPFPVDLQLEKNGGWAVHATPSILLGAFANTPLYGGGMKIAPRAQPDDGLLDVCLIRNLPKLRLLRLFPTVYSGNHLSLPEVEYFRTPRVRLHTNPPHDVFADGEFVCQTPVEISLASGALQVIVP
jgi:diacylglycerol kinase (ATP)